MKVVCPSCKAQYEVDDCEKGRNAECVCGQKFVIEEVILKLTVANKKRSVAKFLLISSGIFLMAIGAFILWHAYDEMQRFGNYSLDAGYTTTSVICSAFGAILLFMPLCRKK